ncbi:primosomal protein N' [Congregibacter litoralis]|uniref:primosomal protein N' n=1 Tax=Congregibacter litoralis TaxID=393662 RepID=UPI00006B18AE|nr:primosomal protein N' [Congregibacter litoralis]
MTQSKKPAVLRVAAPVPLRRPFDYLAPESQNPDRLRPGIRLRVPFGKREITAILLEVAAEASVNAEQLRPALDVLDDKPLLTPGIMALCKWSSDYYQHPVGEVFSAAIPKALREGRGLSETHWRLTTEGKGLPEGALSRAKSQAKALALLQTGEQLPEVLKNAGISGAVLRELTAKGLVERCRITTSLPSAALKENGPPLSEEQGSAVAAVEWDSFSCHLLQGVTGSGKTEVYLRLIAACLDRGEQALVLIPEIGLTPQTVKRFEARFQSPVAVLHSGLSDGQRFAAWQAAQSGTAGIVMGTRSAIFTPLARPGLIIVDEEHDGSYKQQDGFRYAARDVAVKRAQLEGCPVMLGSATPSLESLENARRERYRHHFLRGRQGGGELPMLQTVDLRGLQLNAGISDYLMAAIRETVEAQKRQALLFLNRRGFAPTLQCHSCGWVAGCDHCDARLTVHLRKRCLRCHHCAAQRALPAQCPDCGGTALLTHGLGTEQTEEFLRNVLSCPVHRVDSDAMRGVDAMQSLLEVAHSEEPCVILGTQMLTKGHHFPAVQLVGVIDADALLYSADFRGEERMAQLVVQVAGRAGRESAGGKVLIQTHYPDDPLFEALRHGHFESITRSLLDKRRASGLPPYGQLMLLRSDARNERDGEAFLRAVQKEVTGFLPPDCQLIGPLPSAMPRRAGRFRWQLWCLSASRGSAMAAARLLVERAEGLRKSRELSWFIDVDPSDVV